MRLASPCLARLISSLALDSHRLVLPRLASPRSGRFARLASLALASARIGSPGSPHPRLALPRSPHVLARPRLASPRSPSPRLACLASALAFLARRACSLASATAPFATGGLAASDMPPSKSSVTQHRHATREDRRTKISGQKATPSLNWGSMSDCTPTRHRSSRGLNG